MPGPASATSTMSRRGLRSRAQLTGTGLAQPKIAPAWADRQDQGQDDRAERIDMPDRVERSGRPRSSAVGSPSRRATRPCATSWKTIAITSGISQTAI